MSSHSTADFQTVAVVTDKAAGTLNMFGLTQVVDFDKSKAFEKVLCGSLLQRLMSYRISQVFQPHFLNSQQQTVLYGATQEVLLTSGGHINAGVPQVSSIPLGFILSLL